MLQKLIDFCFHGGENIFVLISYFGARSVKGKANSQLCFSKQGIEDVANFILFICYFTVDKKFFSHIIGIPLGSDPAPFFVNIFLYYYERWSIKDLHKKCLIKARTLCNVFCFINNLNVINDAEIFTSNLKDIHPGRLELHRENGNNTKANFLDRDIKIKNNQFQMGLFGKRDSFSFSMVRMPEQSSNIPSSMFYKYNS